jgi:ParB-like chromosome segregation protein Spo0J
MARWAAIMTGVALGFNPEPLSLPMDRILPSRKVPVGLATTRKFRQIRSSIEEIGLIEPLSVTSVDAATGQHMLLDGHVRMVVLRDLGHDTAPCLMATDDEAYTYNNRVNRLSTIQEHLMIRRAVDRGVSPERLAKALSVDVSQITKKMNLLEGICPEAVELFKDRQFSVELARVVRKMKPTRQVECAELMVSANNLTVAYAEALLVASPADTLIDGKRARNVSGVTPEQMARMEREMASLQGQYRLVEQSYGQDVLNLVLARGYLAKLLENPTVSKFIKQRQPEVLEQFVSIVEATALD